MELPCKAACLNDPACKGLEFSAGRCEVWTRQAGIQASAEVGMCQQELSCIPQSHLENENEAAYSSMILRTLRSRASLALRCPSTPAASSLWKARAKPAAERAPPITRRPTTRLFRTKAGAPLHFRCLMRDSLKHEEKSNLLSSFSFRLHHHLLMITIFFSCSASSWYGASSDKDHAIMITAKQF